MKDLQIPIRISEVFQEKELIIVILSISILILLVFIIVVFFVIRSRQAPDPSINVYQHGQSSPLSSAQDDQQKYADHTRNLVSIYQELRMSQQDIEVFLYQAYHNFLGPIATIRGVCNIASLETQDVAALDYFEKVRTVSDNMHAMLEKLLEISTIHDCEIKIKPTRLSKIMTDFEEQIMNTNLVQAVHIKSECGSSMTLDIDEYLLQTALIKIIRSTMPFRRHSDYMKIAPHIFCSETAEHQTIEMKDYDLSIPNEVSDQAFKMFFRGTHQSEDHGLGLYTARFAVRRMGGELQIDAKKGYTSFIFRFPKFTSHINSIKDLTNSIEKFTQA